MIVRENHDVSWPAGLPRNWGARAICRQQAGIDWPQITSILAECNRFTRGGSGYFKWRPRTDNWSGSGILLWLAVIAAAF
jgi:hypothetical protein